ncbi:MAG: hypothetical protein ACERK9_14040 [Deltaproteobacteria bacterium]
MNGKLSRLLGKDLSIKWKAEDRSLMSASGMEDTGMGTYGLASGS